MDQAIKRRWVTALRSGEYKQGRGALRSKDDRFCCLDVLCDLAAQDGLGRWGVESDGFVFREKSGLQNSGMPAEPIIRWADLMVVGQLAIMNDDGKKSFTEIADFIEREL
jgi:hypothetical protein